MLHLHLHLVNVYIMLTSDKNSEWPYFGFRSKCTIAASVLNTVAFMSYKAQDSIRMPKYDCNHNYNYNYKQYTATDNWQRKPQMNAISNMKCSCHLEGRSNVDVEISVVSFFAVRCGWMIHPTAILAKQYIESYSKCVKRWIGRVVSGKHDATTLNPYTNPECHNA